jgi:hypothetical protein
MELQKQHHRVDGSGDVPSPRDWVEDGACSVLRPAVDHQRQRRLKGKHAPFHMLCKGQPNQYARTKSQGCQQWVPWLLSVFILYMFIPLDSSYLSWLGLDFPLLHAAQEVFKPATSSLSPGQSFLNDTMSSPNVSRMWLQVSTPDYD